MPWYQLTLNCKRETALDLEPLLLEAGAVSVTLQDAEDEALFQVELESTPLWQQVQLSALFEDEATALAAREGLPGRSDARPCQLEVLPDQDWERAWMDDFKPMPFGRRLWICPTWSTPPQPDAVNIMLDPGLAFGSGTHPTTAMCLRWLDSQELQGCRVIDYGCGSGVLAIAAALLGAQQVLAIDNDPQAIRATINNRNANGISDQQLSAHLPGEHPRQAADILLANILCGPLQSLTPILAGLVQAGGQIILSGVLSEQTEALIHSYHEYFVMQDPVHEGEWVSVVGVRRPD